VRCPGGIRALSHRAVGPGYRRITAGFLVLFVVLLSIRSRWSGWGNRRLVVVCGGFANLGKPCQVL